MRTVVAAGALLASLGNAPLQCGHGSDSGVHVEDPGDALYALAQDFHAKGNDAASKDTLRYLLAHYPSNRHAPAARAELDAAGGLDPKNDARK
jgi:hypothetical protein